MQSGELWGTRGVCQTHGVRTQRGIKSVPPYLVRGGRSIQILAHFLPFIKRFGFDYSSFHLEGWKLPKASFLFPQLNSYNYLHHLVIFLVLKFYFSMFLKLCIVSWLFVFVLFYKQKNWCYAFKGVNICWKKSQVFMEGVEFWTKDVVFEKYMDPKRVNQWIGRTDR